MHIPPLSQLRLSSAVFVSDIHLSEDTPLLLTQWRLFCAKLDPAQTEWLIILGDLFEGYCGDDDNSPIVLAIEAVLLDLHTRGIRVAFMHGNRDFVLGAAFAARNHVTLLADPCVLNNHIVLSHGDRYCTLDTGYQAFRAQSRVPAWQAAFLSQPLRTRLAQIQAYRQQSKDVQFKAAQMDVSNALTDAVPTEFMREAAELGCDTVLHGHTHRPCDERLSPSLRRIVLGDWQAGSVLSHVAQLRGGALELAALPPVV